MKITPKVTYLWLTAVTFLCDLCHSLDRAALQGWDEFIMQR